MKLHPDKKPFRILRKWKEKDVNYVEYEADFWYHSGEMDGVMGYYTLRRIATPDDLFSINNSISWKSDIKKALGVK